MDTLSFYVFNQEELDRNCSYLEECEEVLNYFIEFASPKNYFGFLFDHEPPHLATITVYFEGFVPASAS